MGITNIQVGDRIENVRTKELFEVTEYQWTFCADCTKLPWMVFCPKSKDPSHIHYRYYRIRNVRSGQEHEVSGDYMNDAQIKGRIRAL